MRIMLPTLAIFSITVPTVAKEVGACHFDSATLAFVGEPLDQARCLLRPVRKYGQIEQQPAQLPVVLSERIGHVFEVDRVKLSARLSVDGVYGDLARLDTSVSKGNDNAPNAPSARYFVIHDTSSPWFGDRAFPDDMETSNAVNRLEAFAGANSVAHVFVNRRGEILLGHDFSQPWRATKLESQAIGLPAKGLFLHVEFVQPRRRDPQGGPKNDAIAVSPGLSESQYQRLALLYTLASARAGRWLIPAFHAALDEGLSDAHDDPQNFEIVQFGTAVTELLTALSSR